MNKAIRKIVMMAGKAIIGRGSLFTPKSEVIKRSDDCLSDKLGFITEKQKIKLDDFNGRNFMYIVTDDKSGNRKFSETWNFKLCDEKIVPFPFYLIEYKPLVNNGALWIYSEQIVEAASHWEGGKIITTYFLTEAEIEMAVFLN